MDVIMRNDFTPELIEKAKQAKSAEELAALAKENGIDISDDEAEEYFERLNKSGELSDEELDGVAGGGCYYKDGRLVVTCDYRCKRFKCSCCGKEFAPKWSEQHKCRGGLRSSDCSTCYYKTNKGIRMLCNHPLNYKR